jgi:hypothetical protein
MEGTKMGHFHEMEREHLTDGLRFFRQYLLLNPGDENAQRWVDHLTWFLHGYAAEANV